MWRLRIGKPVANDPLLPSLNDCAGRLFWEYDGTPDSEDQTVFHDKARQDFSQNRNQQKHSSDMLYRSQFGGYAEVERRQLSLCDDNAIEEDIDDSIRSGIQYFHSIQPEQGLWPGDYGGPMFLMPGLIIALYVSKALNRTLSSHHKAEMLRYLRNHQNEDGGFGLHIEGHSTMFGTVLSYVSLRILGLEADDKSCLKAREWIHSRNGATYITSWGKFWLAVLGCYAWDGLNPTPPEFWLLPYPGWTGVGWIHPGRYWCHCRQVYLPMSYMYGLRATGELTSLVLSLREELYVSDYNAIDWNAARNECAKEDLYYPHPWYQDLLWWGLYKLEPALMGSSLRKKALAEAMRHVHYEDENTRYICIGPVNKALNLLCCYFEDPSSLAFQKHLARVPDYLWVAEDGMKMQGYCNSTLWDTAFAVQAIYSTGLAPEFTVCLRKAHAAIDAAQVREDCPGNLEAWYRHISKGAWPFSTRDHGWPIADCSAEGLKAALCLADLGPDKVGKLISADRLFDCVNVILSYQNPSGGWATYENTRSFAWVEKFNPAETFGDIMIDYDYVELSSACMTGLAEFRKRYPDHRRAEILSALQRGRDFILKDQRPDGSWCDALAAVGEDARTSTAVRKACEFLLQHQREDGGWGESYLSSQDKVYSDLGVSQVVQTAWSLLALLAAKWHEIDCTPMEAAVKYLVSKQRNNGDWPQQHITGVFNRNCMISYSNYRSAVHPDSA